MSVQQLTWRWPISKIIYLVRKNMCVNEHEKLSNITLKHKLKEGTLSWLTQLDLIKTALIIGMTNNNYCGWYNIMWSKFVSGLRQVGGFLQQ